MPLMHTWRGDGSLVLSQAVPTGNLRPLGICMAISRGKCEQITGQIIGFWGTKGAPYVPTVLVFPSWLEVDGSFEQAICNRLHGHAKVHVTG